MTQIQKTILHDEITDLLETIREQFETLNAFEGKIPILEFEIIKDNVRKLYEKLYLLQRMNDPFDLARQKEQTVEKSREHEEIKEVPANTDVTSSEIHVAAVEEKSPDKTTEEKEIPPETPAEPLKADLFTLETSAFNEKLKEAREQSLGTRSRQTGSADIKSLVNINDKFLFINELFDGDYKEYSHTIEIFNNFDDKGEAFEFLDSLLKNNLWNSTSPAFLKLKEIVEKRFS
jgi:hypothetical protein